MSMKSKLIGAYCWKDMNKLKEPIMREKGKRAFIEKISRKRGKNGSNK